jgi:DNA-binding HxlR family transcriptional regulator
MKAANPPETLKLVAGCGDICPVKKTAELIEGKWTSLIIRELLSGKKRYFEIQKALVDISPKVLSTRLRMLERKGIVTRSVIPTVPPSTEYELSGLGIKLEAVLQAMAHFGIEMLKEES